jgi:hypothetical protein
MDPITDLIKLRVLFDGEPTIHNKARPVKDWGVPLFTDCMVSTPWLVHYLLHWGLKRVVTMSEAAQEVLSALGRVSLRGTHSIPWRQGECDGFAVLQDGRGADWGPLKQTVWTPCESSHVYLHPGQTTIVLTDLMWLAVPLATGRSQEALAFLDFAIYVLTGAIENHALSKDRQGKVRTVDILAATRRVGQRGHLPADILFVLGESRNPAQQLQTYKDQGVDGGANPTGIIHRRNNIYLQRSRKCLEGVVTLSVALDATSAGGKSHEIMVLFDVEKQVACYAPPQASPSLIW